MFAARQNFFKRNNMTRIGPLTLTIDPSLDANAPAPASPGFLIYLTIPIGYTASIDWGDGNTTAVTGAAGEQTFTHTYSTSSTKTVQITADRYSVRFDTSGTPSNSNTRRILSVDNWGAGKLTSARYMFAFTDTAFTINATDTPDLSICTSTFNMFQFSAFNQSINNWDVGNITYMNGMFFGSAFNQIISGWNVSNVTDMGSMFSSSSFNQPIGNWNVSNVTNMDSMFLGNGSFNQDISGWNTSSVTVMGAMFTAAIAFNQPIGTWNTSSVTNMALMFNQTLAFNQDISAWDVSNVTTMQDMFNAATIFNQNISSWDVGSVTNMSGMFKNATAFNQNLSPWITGLIAQPIGFSTGANATWVANKATRFPFLSNGTTRIIS